MDLGIALVVRETLGSLWKIAESIEKTVESIKRTSESISSSWEQRKIRKIADALASFYFTPVGVRRDLEVFIKYPSYENREILSERLEENQEIISDFKRLVYENMDVGKFELPISDVDFLFGAKSDLWLKIMDSSTWDIEQLSHEEKQALLDDMNQSFDDFNEKLEKVIRSISGLQNVHR